MCESLKQSFKKTHLVPLRLPTTIKFGAFACVSSIQCGSGKKASELEAVKADAFSTATLTQERTSNEMVIIKAKNDTSRTLLIRTAAYNAVYHSVVIPAQKLKDIQQEIDHAKTIKVTNATNVRKSRMNPDTSSGLYVTSEVAAAARRVDTLKALDKKEAAERAVRTAEKNVALSKKKEEAFKRIIVTIQNKTTTTSRKDLPLIH